MNVHLGPVTRENFRQIADLQLLESQRPMLYSNAFSIAQASFHPHYQTRAIFRGDEPIGFLMYVEPEPGQPAGEYSIWRFMIDARHQRKGYGRQAMRVLIDEIRSKRDARRIFILYWPANETARKLYRSLGFVDVGTDAEGETVAELTAIPDEAAFLTAKTRS